MTGKTLFVARDVVVFVFVFVGERIDVIAEKKKYAEFAFANM